MLDAWRRLTSDPKSRNALYALVGIVVLILIMGAAVMFGSGGGDKTVAAKDSSLYSLDAGEMLLNLTLRFAVVIALVYLFFWGLRRWQNNGKAAASTRRLSVVERLSLSPRQSICLVRVGKREFMVGMTDQSMTLLAEVEPETETVTTLANQPAGLDFAGLFQQRLTGPLGRIKPKSVESIDKPGE
jgi:flagellar biosynthetic protein FliO